MKNLRIALDGCYPSFWDTDLVMRIIRSGFVPVLVSRLSSYDLIIRGPFAAGNRKRKIASKFINTFTQVRQSSCSPISLHVSSENETLPNYQSFKQSKCDYGVGHEILQTPDYFRAPHWYNYVDFSSIGIISPTCWPRLGKPISLHELVNPIRWNIGAPSKAAFIVSNMSSQRQYLFSSLAKILPVDGFGKAFCPAIKNHSDSGFIKRELLRNYQFCFCPENSISPGYYTEKIPEAYISGTIPISYCESSMVHLDFAPGAFINLNDYILDSKTDINDLKHKICDHRFLDGILTTPLIKYDLQGIVLSLKEFILEIALNALS